MHEEFILPLKQNSNVITVHSLRERRQEKWNVFTLLLCLETMAPSTLASRSAARRIRRRRHLLAVRCYCFIRLGWVGLGVGRWLRRSLRPTAWRGRSLLATCACPKVASGTGDCGARALFSAAPLPPRAVVFSSRRRRRRR